VVAAPWKNTMENGSPAAQRATPHLADGDARLRLVLEETGLATWETDFERRESIWSANHFRLFGYPVDAAGRATLEMWSSRLHPEDRQRVLAELNSAKRERAPYRSEYRIIRADSGETIWLESRGRFLYDAVGNLLGLVGMCLETTARKQAEERLVRRETQLDLATRTVGIGVFDHDHLEDKLYWSDQFRRIHGASPDLEPHLLALDAQIHPEDRERLYAAVRAAHAPTSDGKFSIEYRIRRADGEVRWVVGRAQTLFVGEGAERRPIRTVGAELDVTDRHLAETRLRESEEALRKADQRKDEFLATLAHELRNPLAPIRTAAEMLTLPNLSDEQLSWSGQVIHRQVEHMARLLDDLLDVARITQGKLQLRLQPVDLGAVVDTAVEAARPLLTARKHGLTVELPPDLPTFVADPVRLAQVLSNLLTNAAKYTDSPGRISLTARVENDGLRIAVSDNGIGLSPAALADVFTMFSQVHDSRARAEGGLGIGLALVKGLVDLHGGTTEVFSEGAGRGSEFVVTLPCSLPETAGAAELIPADKAGDATTCRKILVADDNQDAANTLALLLRLAGHDVRTAYGGHTALTLAREFQPEFALLDIGMPDLDGYEVARQLRLTDGGKNVRLIALTGWGQDEDKRRAREAGFDQHLTKPVDPQRLDALFAQRGA
jgi:PAS domain S-box-containing protein